MFKTRTTKVHTATLADGVELELEFLPCEWTEDHTIETRIGDNKIVLSYLVHDECPGINPLKDHDCQGDIYTRNERIVTDDEDELLRALCLDAYGQPAIDKDFVPTEGHPPMTLRELAAAEMLAMLRNNPEETQAWIEQEWDDPQFTVDEFWADLKLWGRLEGDLEDPYGRVRSEVEERAFDLYKVHWRRLVGPYVVPMNYFSHYDTTISVTSWDGDWDDLPNCVWVADKGAIENITPYPDNVSVEWHGQPSQYKVLDQGVQVFLGSFGECHKYIKDNYPATGFDELLKASEKYAESVADEYAKWCSGEVFGCVTETFERQEDDTWEQISEDSCWGYIGEEHASQSLKSDHHDYAVGRAQKESA